MENPECKEELDDYCNEKGEDINLFLDLGAPIDEEYIETHRKRNMKNNLNEFGLEEKQNHFEHPMDDLEADYALQLVKIGLIVYREPHLIQQDKNSKEEGNMCHSIPDFYVYHPELKDGVLVEITRYSKDCSSKAKKEQHKNLGKFCEKYHIPFIPLFGEDLETMGLSLTIKKLTSELQ